MRWKQINRWLHWNPDLYKVYWTHHLYGHHLFILQGAKKGQYLSNPKKIGTVSNLYCIYLQTCKLDVQTSENLLLQVSWFKCCVGKSISIVGGVVSSSVYQQNTLKSRKTASITLKQEDCWRYLKLVLFDAKICKDGIILLSDASSSSK